MKDTDKSTAMKAALTDLYIGLSWFSLGLLLVAHAAWQLQGV